MELNDFSKGQESLLQALAIMRDEEEFKRRYGGIHDLISSRRETSVTAMCNIIVRLKCELKSQVEARRKCAKQLEDIAGWWKELQDDREGKAEKIKSLEQERSELLKKIEHLESASRRSGSSTEDQYQESDGKESRGSRDSLEHNVSKGSSMQQDSDKIHIFHPHNDSLDLYLNLSPNSSQRVSPHISPNRPNEDDGDFKSSRFDTRPENPCEISEPFSSQISSRVDFSHPLLTYNPYDALDSSYYNPTQFFHRQSTTTVRREKGKRGGSTLASTRATGTTRTKKNAESSNGTAKATKKRKSQAGESSVAEAIQIDDDFDIQLDYEIVRETSNSNATNKGMEKSDDVESEESTAQLAQVENNDVSPGKSYFDYTSTFLDET